MTSKCRFVPRLAEFRDLSTREIVRAICNDGTIFELEDAVDLPPKQYGGRPREFAVWIHIMFDTLVHVHGSARAVEREIKDVWQVLRTVHGLRYPGRTPLPSRTLRRSNYAYTRDRYLATNDWIEKTRVILRNRAVKYAEARGLGFEDGEGTVTKPSKGRTVRGDGKAVASRYGQRRRGYKGRRDPDARHHITGDDKDVFGSLFVIAAIGDDNRGQSLVLDAAAVRRGSGGEAAVFMDSMDGLLDVMPGVQLVAYDGAGRGVHHQRTMDRGVAMISPIHGKKTGKKKHVPKVVFVETVKITRADGSCQVRDLYSVDGAAAFRETKVDGTPFEVLLEMQKPLKRRNKQGGYRWYGDFKVPESAGGGCLRIRLDTTEEDRKRGFNRTEHLRMFPPSHPDYEQLYGRRNLIESINRLYDDSLDREKAHTVGIRRQSVNVATFMLAFNVRSMERHRRCLSDNDVGLAA